MPRNATCLAINRSRSTIVWCSRPDFIAEHVKNRPNLRPLLADLDQGKTADDGIAVKSPRGIDPRFPRWRCVFLTVAVKYDIKINAVLTI